MCTGVHREARAETPAHSHAHARALTRTRTRARAHAPACRAPCRSWRRMSSSQERRTRRLTRSGSRQIHRHDLSSPRRARYWCLCLSASICVRVHVELWRESAPLSAFADVSSEFEKSHSLSISRARARARALSLPPSLPLSLSLSLSLPLCVYTRAHVCMQVLAGVVSTLTSQPGDTVLSEMNKVLYVCTLSVSLALSPTHVHTCMHVYMHVCVLYKFMIKCVIYGAAGH